MRSRTSLYLAASLFLAAPAMAQTQCAVPSPPVQTSAPQKAASLGPQPTDAIQRLVQAGSEILWAEPQHGLQTGVAHGDNQLLGKRTRIAQFTSVFVILFRREQDDMPAIKSR